MRTGLKIGYVDDIEMFYNIWNPYQIKYDCNIDRRFDNSKINRATNNKLQYTLVAEGINKCLKKFIESPEWRNINWKLNFWMDNITGTKFDTFYFESMGNKFIQRGKPRRFGLTVRLNFNSAN